MPRDITGRVLGRSILSPFGPREHPLRRRLGWVLLGVIAWVLYAAVFSDHSFLRIARLRAELGAAQHELERVDAEAGQLRTRLADPRARSAHAEATLREEHGMARPGEVVYRFRDGVLDTARTR
jgi:cell division protein FtsB